MTQPLASQLPMARLPDHTQLPDRDGVPVRSSQEPYQSALLTDPLLQVLQRQYPEGDFFIGQDCGIYWKLTDPPERGAKSPDWYLVLGVPHLLSGIIRRSYVMWQEHIGPLLTVEYALEDSSQERDRTPWEGKFWVYERVIRSAYYAIYQAECGGLEVYHNVDGQYQPLSPNEREHYAIPVLGLELGIWQGKYDGYDMPWLRWWDAQGNILMTSKEQVEQALHRTEQGSQRAERLAAKLRELGVDPETL